ncbi:MAG: NAD+ synthase, partial [Planctomycetota bacterium]|jgi:NAD+ synthetase
VDGAKQTVERLARRTEDGPALLVGFPERNPDPLGNALFNACALLAEGEIRSVHRKSLLPTYDVFDEARYFQPSPTVAPAMVAGRTLAISVCEDMWLEGPFAEGRSYGRDPLGELIDHKPDLLINVSASPWSLGKTGIREALCQKHAARAGVPIAFCNQVGGEDELIFDGSSMVVMPDGTVAARARSFREDLLFFDLERGKGEVRAQETHTPEIEHVRQALVLGVRDYFRKAGGFKRAVIGLSGGIDSAVVATLAADALGPENILGIRMPSRYSSDHSLDDAGALAKNLGIGLETLPIEAIFPSFLETLKPVFEDRPFGVAEENVQARIRGTLLMAVSNKLGHLVLSTGNKSELAVGYCTLYGDMNGGLAVISDVPKTMVYELARHLNEGGERIPANTISKPPSAELRPDQKDQDSLPPYGMLDEILEAYVERRQSAAEIEAEGYPRETIDRVVGLVQRNEYKRRQAAPGLRITTKAFGVGRRIPLAASHQYADRAANEPGA